MSALPLFDVILSTGRASDSADLSRLARLAGRLAQSALAELGEIEGFEACVTPSDAAAPAADEHVAALLRGMYEQWVRDADAVLQRIAQVERQGVTVDGAPELRDAQGRTLAMLSVPPADLARARADVQAGRTLTLQEVRRELRLGVH